MHGAKPKLAEASIPMENGNFDRNSRDFFGYKFYVV